MKILFVNAVCGIGSTGKICCSLAEKMENTNDSGESKNECKIAYGREKYVPEKYRKYAIRIGRKPDTLFHAMKTRILDVHGLGSAHATKKFLQWAESYNPDMVWLHIIHGYYINYELLFEWIKSRPQMIVRWTMHDCWAFTGHCTYFDYIDCEKWKTYCVNCPQKREYPTSVFRDNSKENFARKKKAFCGVSNMTIITPSQWLADLVGQSFLKEYPIIVKKNEIDRCIFKPTVSAFRESYNIGTKRIILGVASGWDAMKGYGDFLRLSKMIDENTVIVMVGFKSDEEIKRLPENIIGLRRTNSARELAEIYTAANVFFNPTYQDNYPTVNLEAEACGTRVVTYKTGGAPETISRPDSVVVPQGNINLAFELLTNDDTVRNNNL